MQKNSLLVIFHRTKDQWPGCVLYHFLHLLCSGEEHRYLLHDCILEIPLVAPCKLESKLWLFLTVTGEPAKPAVLLMVGVLGIRARLGMLLRSLSAAKEDNTHSQVRTSNKHKQPQRQSCRKSGNQNYNKLFQQKEMFCSTRRKQIRYWQPSNWTIMATVTAWLFTSNFKDTNRQYICRTARI